MRAVETILPSENVAVTVTSTAVPGVNVVPGGESTRPELLPVWP